MRNAEDQSMHRTAALHLVEYQETPPSTNGIPSLASLLQVYRYRLQSSTRAFVSVAARGLSLISVPDCMQQAWEREQAYCYFFPGQSTFRTGQGTRQRIPGHLATMLLLTYGTPFLTKFRMCGTPFITKFRMRLTSLKSAWSSVKSAWSSVKSAWSSVKSAWSSHACLNWACYFMFSNILRRVRGSVTVSTSRRDPNDVMYIVYNYCMCNHYVMSIVYI